MHADDPARLLTLVELKTALLERVWELGQRQLQLIAAGDYGDLLKLLGVKQRVLAGLRDVEQGLAPFRQQDPEQRHWNSSVERAQCQRQMTRCEELLALILHQEQQSETQMIQHREETAAQLLQLQHTAEIHGAYDSQDWTAATAAQLDLSSEG